MPAYCLTELLIDFQPETGFGHQTVIARLSQLIIPVCKMFPSSQTRYEISLRKTGLDIVGIKQLVAIRDARYY